MSCDNTAPLTDQEDNQNARRLSAKRLSSTVIMLLKSLITFECLFDLSKRNPLSDSYPVMQLRRGDINSIAELIVSVKCSYMVFVNLPCYQKPRLNFGHRTKPTTGQSLFGRCRQSSRVEMAKSRFRTADAGPDRCPRSAGPGQLGSQCPALGGVLNQGCFGFRDAIDETTTRKRNLAQWTRTKALITVLLRVVKLSYSRAQAAQALGAFLLSVQQRGRR